MTNRHLHDGVQPKVGLVPDRDKYSGNQAKLVVKSQEF